MSTDEQRDLFRGAACEDLAKMYHLGIGIQPDRDEAERWYRAAVANHNKSVMNNLGILLFEGGRRVEAIQWLTEAANETHKQSISDRISRNWDRASYIGVPEQTIRLSVITENYLDCMINFQYFEEDNWDELLRGLPDLTLDKDYVLDDFRSRKLTNSILILYARKRSQSRPSDGDFEHLYKESVEPLDVFRCITLPFTEEAIWQAFLLSQTYHLVGMRWHGGYEKRTFIVSDKDIAGLEPFSYLSDSRNIDFVHLQEQMQNIWMPELCASVSLFDNYAIVSHCWFNLWKGLSLVKWKVKYDVRKKRVVEIEKESEQVLVKYHCGVWF